MEEQPRKKYLIGTLVLVAVLVIGAIASGIPAKMLKGDFDFDFKRRIDPLEIDIPTTTELFRSRRLDDITRLQERMDDWQKKISDDPLPVLDENGYTPEEAAKKKQQQEEEEAAKQAKIEQDLANTILNVAPSKAMMSVIEEKASNVTSQKPLKANQYSLCASGPSNVVITNVRFMSQGSDHTSTAYLEISGKSNSVSVVINQDWTGDFMTVDNYQLAANSCVEVGMKLVGVQEKALWQRISLVGVKANVKVEYQNPVTDGYGYNNETLIAGTYLAYSSVNTLSAANANYSKQQAYKINTPGELSYGTYGFYTSKNSKASLSALKISLVTKDYDAITFQTKTTLPKVYNWGTENLGQYSWDASSAPAGDSAPPEPSITLKAGEEVTIPLQATLSYSSVTFLKISAFKSAPPTKGSFAFKITGVMTDGTLVTDLQALEPTNISIINDATTSASAKIFYGPFKGSKKWIDSTDAQNNIDTEGTYYLASIDTNLTGVNLADTTFKDLSIKFDGIFKEPLKLQFYNGSTNTLISKKTISKGDIVTLSDFSANYIEIRAENIPGDPKFPLHIKPKITNLILQFNKDIGNYKQGQSLPLFIEEYNQDKQDWVTIPVTTFPLSFGIISVGPTTLNYIDFGNGNSNTGAPQLVSIANLPKGQNSEFTMNEACFLAQGHVKMYGATYKHLSRETSPFKDIKLQIGGNTNVYLKPADWTKENSTFSLSAPFDHSNENIWCYKLVVLDPVEPVEDIWFDLINLIAKTPGGNPVPVFIKTLPLENNPVKGPVYIFK